MLYNEEKYSFINFSVSMIVFGVIVCANTDNINAIKVQYPIVVNNVSTYQDIPMVSIEDRLYLPLRALCDVLNIKINWKEEGKVTIDSNKNQENIKDYNISPNMALEIADVIFEEKFGKDFIKNTKASIEVMDDSYKVYRALQGPILGGDGTVYIGKKDGRIIDIMAGE